MIRPRRAGPHWCLLAGLGSPVAACRRRSARGDYEVLMSMEVCRPRSDSFTRVASRLSFHMNVRSGIFSSLAAWVLLPPLELRAASMLRRSSSSLAARRSCDAGSPGAHWLLHRLRRPEAREHPWATEQGPRAPVPRPALVLGLVRWRRDLVEGDCGLSVF
jgi:hypothetical protein